MHNPFPLLGQTLRAWIDGEAKPTLAERNADTIAVLLQESNSIASRLTQLEKHEANINAYYMHTLGKALKQDQDSSFARLERKLFDRTEELESEYDRILDKHERTWAALLEAQSTLSLELAKTNARITSILQSLRVLGDTP